MFLPWSLINTDIGEGGLVAGARLTTLQTAANKFLSELAVQSVPMVLLPRPSAPGTEHPTPPGAPSPVTSLVVDKLISTQRRRLGR
jgi:hypothetical protein